MAYEMEIRGTQDRVKIRSPWAAALLPLITFGIYHLVWWYRINREMRDYGRAKGYDLGQNPTNSLLALFPGALIVVPALVTYWRGTKRAMGASRLAGQEPLNGWIAIILYLLIGPVFYKERYATRYGLDKMMSVETILERLNADGVQAEQIEDFDGIARHIAKEAREGDVVLVMSSGAFGGVHEKILSALKS